jgi:hypothetical protein
MVRSRNKVDTMRKFLIVLLLTSAMRSSVIALFFFEEMEGR